MEQNTRDGRLDGWTGCNDNDEFRVEQEISIAYNKKSALEKPERTFFIYRTMNLPATLPSLSNVCILLLDLQGA